MLISQKLINWYQVHKRDLPWRHTNDPYNILLSEMILQQTRVDQGISYYYKFIERFPNIEDLAKADEQEVLRLWQGLGYYSRARNLLHTAQFIVSEYNGEFPKEYKKLLALKGVGDYTAAAIASHAFDLHYAVVDGNVYRFLARYFAIEEAIDTSKGKKLFKNIANDLLDKQRPGLHNQAIMEFGALHCKPQNPKCTNCPFMENCQAFADKKIDLLPIKKGKTKIRNRYFNYFIVQNTKKEISMKKRTEKDVWFNLYDFPLIETLTHLSELELFETNAAEMIFNSVNYTIKNIFPIQVHLLSHQKLHLRFIEIDLVSENLTEKFRNYSFEEIEKLPLPRPIDQFLSGFSK